jgi:hypothetical protein
MVAAGMQAAQREAEAAGMQRAALSQALASLQVGASGC